MDTSSQTTEALMQHERHFTEPRFWRKLRGSVDRIGASLMGTALTLYYAAQDPDTPAWVRRTLLGALGYFILPLDALPDILPLVGYTDDLSMLMLATATLAAHIKGAHKEHARHALDAWQSTSRKAAPFTPQ